MLFKRLAMLGAVMALCVVVLGAYVRLTDAGLGCPDWPGRKLFIQIVLLKQEKLGVKCYTAIWLAL